MFWCHTYIKNINYKQYTFGYLLSQFKLTSSSAWPEPFTPGLSASDNSRLLSFDWTTVIALVHSIGHLGPDLSAKA